MQVSLYILGGSQAPAFCIATYMLKEVVNKLAHIEYEEVFLAQATSKTIKKCYSKRIFQDPPLVGSLSYRRMLFHMSFYLCKEKLWQCEGIDVREGKWRTVPPLESINPSLNETFSEESLVAGGGGLVCANVPGSLQY